jgi:hypothetical protein
VREGEGRGETRSSAITDGINAENCKTAGLWTLGDEPPPSSTEVEWFEPTGSKHGERTGALDQNPGPASSKEQRDDLPHHFAAAQDGVMTIHFVSTAIVFCQKTGKARIAATAAWISGQSKTDGGSATEIYQKTQHGQCIGTSRKFDIVFSRGISLTSAFNVFFQRFPCTTSATPARI